MRYRQRTRGGVAVLLTGLLMSCQGGSAQAVSDAAGFDAGIPDATQVDGSPTDGSLPDAASVDAGFAADADLDFDTGLVQLARKTWRLPNGVLAEARLRMTKGSTVVAEFSANNDVEWDVHVHDGQGFVIVVEGSAQSARVPFVAPEDGRYFYGFYNGHDHTLRIDAVIHGVRDEVVVELLTP